MSIFNKVRPFNKGGGKITVAFNAKDKEPATIQIYEDIGEDPWSGAGFTAQDFADALSDIPKSKPIDVRVNTAGGSMFEGQAIKTRFDEWPSRKTVSYDGIAASVGSWFCINADEIRAPRHAQYFIHDAWGIVAGPASELRNTANQLEKSSQQIAEMYARKTGMSVNECRKLMTENSGTLMTAEEAHAKGFIDRITDEEAIGNFTDKQVSNMRNHISVMRNSISAHKSGATNNDKTEDQMNREAMIALLNKWGVKFENSASDEQLEALIAAGKPQPENKKTEPVKSSEKNKKKGDDDDEDDDEEDCKNKKADKTLAMALNAAEKAQKYADQILAQATNQLKESVINRVKGFIEADQVPAAQLDSIVNLALANAGLDGGVDKVLNVFAAITPRQPGFQPLNVQYGETSSIEDLNRGMKKLNEVQDFFCRNHAKPTRADRELIGQNAAEKMRIVNRLKKYNDAGEMVGPLRDMWDAWAASPITSPRNANTMDTQLLRQVILSEIMRAFKRQFATLNLFAHTYQNVPLEGTDKVEVPYYPLDTNASTEFKYANGYVVAANAQTLHKEITVGGIGNSVASAGVGRKYKTLQFTAYEIRRQPWLNIAQLTVMAGEQLAIDVRADIMGPNISAANFGNAIWTGAAGGFDHTVVTQYLLNAAIKAFWPMTARHCVLAPDYYTTLLADPNLSRYLEAGSDQSLRDATVGKLYGFQEITYDALLPVANFIRGGDGTVTAGSDTSSAGFISYPSALLIATAPIMPPPGVLKKLVSYEQVTDDMTGLSFTYQYFGIEKDNADSEIIECTYGSAVGETAALKRLTSAGV